MTKIKRRKRTYIWRLGARKPRALSVVPLTRARAGLQRSGRTLLRGKAGKTTTAFASQEQSTVLTAAEDTGVRAQRASNSCCPRLLPPRVVVVAASYARPLSSWIHVS